MAKIRLPLLPFPIKPPTSFPKELTLLLTIPLLLAFHLRFPIKPPTLELLTLLATISESCTKPLLRFPPLPIIPPTTSFPKIILSSTFTLLIAL